MTSTSGCVGSVEAAAVSVAESWGSLLIRVAKVRVAIISVAPEGLSKSSFVVGTCMDDRFITLLSVESLVLGSNVSNASFPSFVVAPADTA